MKKIESKTIKRSRIRSVSNSQPTGYEARTKRAWLSRAVMKNALKLSIQCYDSNNYPNSKNGLRFALALPDQPESAENRFWR